jgi:hypothetical protein
MRSIFGFCVVAVLVLLIFTHLFGNLWMLLTGNGYTIPRESSVFTFHPTEMNDGAGDWWIYGEDDQFYYFIADGGARYKIYPREKADTCPHFSPTSFETWCP